MFLALVIVQNLVFLMVLIFWVVFLKKLLLEVLVGSCNMMLMKKCKVLLMTMLVKLTLMLPKLMNLMKL